MGRCMFSYPFVSQDTDLKFENHYGDVPTEVLDAGMKTVAVAAVSSSPRKNYVEDIRRQVAEAIDSIPNADIKFASLSLSLEKIYFAVTHDIPPSDQEVFLRHGAFFFGQYKLQLRDSQLKIGRIQCEWEDPRQVMEVIKKSGAEEVSHDTLAPRVDLLLWGPIVKEGDCTQRQCFGHRLTLNAETLAVDRWRVQNWYPMSCYFMHTFPSSSDVMLRTHVERSVSMSDIRGRRSEMPAVLDGPLLGGWLTRSDVGYEGKCSDVGVRKIAENKDSEKFTFGLKNVNFSITLQSTYYYTYSPETNKFSLTDDVICESTLHFRCTENREDLVDAVTLLVDTLLQSSNDGEAMPLTTSPTYIYDITGSRVPGVDIQGIMRLKYEEGWLWKMLGLGENASIAVCRQKAEDLMSLLESSQGQAWIEEKEVNLEFLIKKLRHAAARKRINI